MFPIFVRVGTMMEVVREERISRMERRKQEWESKMLIKSIILDLVDGVERRIVTNVMKEFVDEVVEEASKEGQVNTWLREIEESGPVIRHRMELCLKLKRMEEERAVKLMLAEVD